MVVAVAVAVVLAFTFAVPDMNTGSSTTTSSSSIGGVGTWLGRRLCNGVLISIPDDVRLPS